MKVAYIRVSTVEQNTARQEEAMKGLGIEKIFIEKVSAKDTNRPQLLSMIDFIREGDIVYVESFSRLARSTEDLLNIVKEIQEKGASIVSLKEGFDLTTPTGKLMLTMMGAIATFEREVMLERQREGIAIAKAEGKYKGRKKIEITPEFVEAYKKYMNRELTVTNAIKELGIKSRTTWYKLVDEYKNKQEQQGVQVEEIQTELPEEPVVLFDGNEAVKVQQKKLNLENKELKKEVSGEWIALAMIKLTKKIKSMLGINILDKDCGASKIERRITEISIEYVFIYEGKTYMFEYLRNLDEIEISTLEERLK